MLRGWSLLECGGASAAGWGRVELLRGDHSSRALGVLVLQSGVDLLGQFRLVLGLVEVG